MNFFSWISGLFAPKNQISAPGIPWVVKVDGDDLVVRCVKVTAFGGGHDTGDDGRTESGLMNDGRDPHLLGCALPIRSTEAATRVSPLAFKGPHIPWQTNVRFWEGDDEQDGVDTVLIDNGPDEVKYPTHAGDLTVYAASLFAPHIPIHEVANRFAMTLSYRIIDGAKWVS